MSTKCLQCGEITRYGLTLLCDECKDIAYKADYGTRLIYWVHKNQDFLDATTVESEVS